MADPAGALQIRGPLRLVGFVTGIVCAIAAHDREPSFLLAVFVFFTASFVIGRALPDVLTRPRPIPHAIYLLLLPGLEVGALTCTYVLVNRMWLSVVVGVIVGRALHGLVASAVFPGIAAEQSSWKVRVGGMGWGAPQADDSVPGRWRRLG